jgi:hypothetical protein
MGYRVSLKCSVQKSGGFSIYLGVMLFFNLFLFFRGKKVAKLKHDEHIAMENRATPNK